MSQASSSSSSSQLPQQGSSAIHILSLLLRLRQSCCHLSLLKKVDTHTHIQTSPAVAFTGADFLPPPPPQTLDSTELQGDGIVLSLEEQLSALSLSSSPSPSGPELKDTVALNGTRFPSKLFEDTSESTKVGHIENAALHFSFNTKPDHSFSSILPDFCHYLRVEGNQREGRSEEVTVGSIFHFGSKIMIHILVHKSLDWIT